MWLLPSSPVLIALIVLLSIGIQYFVASLASLCIIFLLFVPSLGSTLFYLSSLGFIPVGHPQELLSC